MTNYITTILCLTLSNFHSLLLYPFKLETLENDNSFLWVSAYKTAQPLYSVAGLFENSFALKLQKNQK